MTIANSAATRVVLALTGYYFWGHLHVWYCLHFGVPFFDAMVYGLFPVPTFGGKVCSGWHILVPKFVTGDNSLWLMADGDGVY